MTNTQSYKKGQVAQEALISLWIYLAFILIILAAENQHLPDILNKQLKQNQQTKNIYDCAVIDTIATFNSSSIEITPTNGTCITKTEWTVKGFRYHRNETRQLD